MKSLAILSLLLGITYSQCASIQPYTSHDGSRIIEGLPANTTQFPFVVRLEISIPGSTLLCGGSLISRRYVLTSGSCLNSTPDLIRVLLGDVDSMQPYIVVESNTYLVHPEFDPASLLNDIALVDLRVNVVTNFNFNVIKLVPLSQATNTFENEVATIAGWGQTVDGQGGELSQYLNYVNVSVISNDECRQIYGPLIVDEHLCTVGKKTPSEGACYGDGGGPLFLADSDGTMMQIGIASFLSTAPCSSNMPNGFVRPHHYWPWISENTDIPISQ